MSGGVGGMAGAISLSPPDLGFQENFSEDTKQLAFKIHHEKIRPA